MRNLTAVAALVFLTSCVSAPEGSPPPPPSRYVPAPAPTVAPPPVAAGSDWRDWALTPGTWRYRASGPGRSTATYGTDGANGFVLSLICDASARAVTLSTVGAPGGQSITVRTASTARSLPTVSMAHADAWPPMTNDARLSATDPLLDAIGFSRGRFVIEQAGERPLVLPAWAEILRVTEDCRG